VAWGELKGGAISSELVECNNHLQTIIVTMRDTITLTNSEFMELTRRANRRTNRAEDARRARLILLLAEGHTWDEVSERIDCYGVDCCPIFLAATPPAGTWRTARPLQITPE
jgi:hypothetical protein